NEPPKLSRLFAIDGGVLQSIKRENECSYLSADGVENCVHALREIEAGRLHDCFMDLRACEGGCAAARTYGQRFVPGDAVTLAVRSEHLDFTIDKTKCGIAANVEEKTFAGGMLRIALRAKSGALLIASRHGIDIEVQVGDEVRVTWDAANAVPVDADDAAPAGMGAKA
ncbi:MAG: TOBE domain-containing protein, partial [Ruthenibacterium sp.]